MSATPPPESTSLVRGGRRLLTVADVAVLPSWLPSGDVRYELHDGVLTTFAPPTYQHSRCVTHILAVLYIHGEKPGHGSAYGRVSILLRQNPDHLIAPPAAFLTATQLPPKTTPQDFLLTIPALVVEVRSKNDTQPEVDAKVREYLTAGVVLVWAAEPDARTVTAYRPNQPAVVFAATDTLTADGVIPRFAVPVADLLPAI